MSMLRKATFERVLDKIHLEFGFDPLTESTKRKYSDARHVLFYVCRKKKRIPLDQIISLLEEKGFTISRPSVLHGIRKIEGLMESDSTIKNLINEMSE
jgi:chromosomal replication initiation ATPase DnaA